MVGKIAIRVAAVLILPAVAFYIHANDSCSSEDAEGPKIGDVIAIGGCATTEIRHPIARRRSAIGSALSLDASDAGNEPGTAIIVSTRTMQFAVRIGGTIEKGLPPPALALLIVMPVVAGLIVIGPGLPAWPRRSGDRRRARSPHQAAPAAG